MPCSDSYGPTDPAVYERLDAATRAACDLFRQLKRLGCEHCGTNDYMAGLSKETQHWVKRHERRDRERREYEAKQKRLKKLKKKVLAKLSREEKEALNY